jgi:predicted DNA-binding mobile mystery protein A
MAKTSAQARRYFDAELARLRLIVEEPRPRRGWIRALRHALGMSSTELAFRMAISQSTISDMEHSEIRDTIKLETLRRAAHALDCDLVYFLVPRTTLDDAVRVQARHKAVQHLAGVTHTVRLDDEAEAMDDTAARLDELALRFMDRRGLWSEPMKPDSHPSPD